MNKDELNDVLFKVQSLSHEEKNAGEILKLLLPYKREMDDLLKKNPKWVSFITPIEKDLFDRFYPEKEKWIYTDFPIAWYYSLLSNAYLDLKRIDDYLENAFKAHGLDPTCSSLTMNIISTIDHYQKSEYYTRSFAMLLSFPKYCTDKEEMADYYYFFAFHLLDSGCREAALACFYLSNQFLPHKDIQESIKNLSRETSYSKATSAKNIKLYSKRYQFATGFSKEVKDFVMDCTTSCLANKDKDAFVYYLEILADMDEAYLPDLKKARQGKKTSLVANPNPIKVSFREMTIQKTVDVIRTVCDVREYLKSAKQRIAEKKKEGISIKDAVDKEKENMEKKSILSYFYLYCLYHLYDLEVPKDIRTELEKNHEAKDMKEYESAAKGFGNLIKENPSDLEDNIGMVYGLYLLKNLPLDVFALSFYFSGYSVDPSYLMKTKPTQKKTFLPLFNEKGEKFQYDYDMEKKRFTLIKVES